MLVFTGDINLTDWYFNVGFGIGTRISNGFNPFKNLNRSTNDIWIGNFEGVASDTSIKKGYEGKAFRVEPAGLMNIEHFDIYGFANNHAMQHGNDAYNNTLNAIESYGSKYFGTSEKHSETFIHQGKQVSITGMSLRIDEFSDAPLYWNNPEYADIINEVKILPKEAFKVLYVHWGNEYINRPSSQQKKFAHWLIDIGFDLIIGMHPHVIQGYEMYKGRYIFYSLGNFVFEMAWEPTKYGVIVRFDLDSNKASINYIKIEEDCAPRIIDESQVPEKWNFQYLNDILITDDNLEQYVAEIEHNYSSYRKANHRYIIQNIIKHPAKGVNLITNYIKRHI